MLIQTILAFITTNIDDIFILMLLFAQGRGKADRYRVTAGQYLGMTVLFVVSIVGGMAARLIPENYINLLGLVPIALGVREIVENFRDDDDDERSSSIGVLSVALLAISNGADNIGVYIPLFSGYSAGDFAVSAVVFAVMTGLLCYLGCKTANLPKVGEVIRKYKKILVPAVFILLGLSILL